MAAISGCNERGESETHLIKVPDTESQDMESKPGDGIDCCDTRLVNSWLKTS